MLADSGDGTVVIMHLQQDVSQHTLRLLMAFAILHLSPGPKAQPLESCRVKLSGKVLCLEHKSQSLEVGNAS